MNGFLIYRFQISVARTELSGRKQFKFIIKKGNCMNTFTTYTASMYNRYIRLLGMMFMVALTAASFAMAIPALNLRSMDNFVILAGSTITGIPPVSITGNVGLSPAAGSYIVGFDGSNVVGTLYVVDASGPAGSVVNATLLQTAKSDLTTAYNDAAGRTPVPTGTFLNPGSGNMGGLNLVAGLYKFTSDAAITGSDLTLTGNSTDVWIFQIASSLNLGSGIHIILAGGAQAANIFWQVGTSATLGTYSVFKGTILADQSVSLGTGASIEGRALAFSAAVTFASGVTSTRAVLISGPFFAVDSTQVRFGNVNNSTSKRDTVTVTNTGTANLIISTVTSSNTLFTVTPTNGTITPGSTQRFFITYAPVANGAQSGYIYFNHNATNARDSLRVSGTGVSPTFSVSPLSLNFGNLRNGLTKRDSLTVTNTGTADLIISTITSSNTSYTITPTNGTITPSSTRKFYVTFAPLTDGLKSGFVYFNHNASNAKDSITVSGTGVSSRFSVSPLSLNFGNVRDGLTKRDSVTVTNSGTADLIISSLTSSNTKFTFTPANGTITPGSSQKYYVTFAPIIDGLQNGFIFFNHNASNPKDSITVSGTGVSSRFSVSPLSLNFGNVRDGLTKRDSVTVTNSGTADLIISSLTSSNTKFTFTPANGTITPGSSQKYYITFAPIIDGLQSGFIYFNHNAGNPKDSITVTGTGVSPLFSANPVILDFGNVNIRSTKRDSVTVTNSGTMDLIISSLTSSNPRFTFTPANGTITAGSAMVFYFTFSPMVDGLQNGFIYFNHNADKPKDSISVSGTGVSPKFTVTPSMLNFGNVNNGLTKRDSVTVTNNGTANLIISSITSSGASFTVNPIIGTILPGASQRFFVTFAPLTDGLKYGNIYFNHNAINGRDSIGVSGVGVSAGFSMFPKTLNFGNVINGTTKMDSVTVTNTGTANLVISSIVTGNIRFVTTVLNAIILPGSSRKFYVAFTPLTSGFQDGYIRFNFNATNAKDSIYVTGTGVGAEVFPKFTVNPSSLDFGTVNSGSQKMDSVTVTNTGSANLIIYGMTSTNVYYYFILGTSIIAPGTSQKFYINFSPLVSGVQNGFIYFYHNAINAMDSIRVTGLAVGNDLAPKFTVKYDLDFGSVFLTTSKMKSVIVTNTGSSNLVISNIVSTDSHYDITPIIETIAPGASKEFFITFTPIVLGKVNSKIIFIHNVGRDTINATGIGIGNIPVITIDSARKLPNGTEFAIEGIVTRTMGSYTRIQDQTAGLTIVQESGAFFEEVKISDIQMGDRMRIQGRISEKSFLKVVSGNDLTGYQRFSRLNELPAPKKVTLSELAANGEKYESCLITLVGLTLPSVKSSNFIEATTYQVTDKSDLTNAVVIRIGNHPDTDMDGMPYLYNSVTFVGVLSQSSATNPLGGYQLTPILPTDLVSEPSGITEPNIAEQYSLSVNYPNPFSNSTTIQYFLGNDDFVSLKVFDVLGKEIVTLVNGFQTAGIHTADFMLTENTLSSGTGIYFYRLEVGTFVSTKQMILLK